MRKQKNYVVLLKISNYANRKMSMQLGYSVEKQDDMYIYVTKSR